MSAYTPIYDMTEKIEMTKKKVAVVPGSSSGIGLETALLLARNGFDTFATMCHCQNYHCKTWYPISINFRHLTFKHIDYAYQKLIRYLHVVFTHFTKRRRNTRTY